MGSFHIVQIGTNGLRIEDPPVYWAATFFVVVALFALLAFSGTFLARFSRSERVVWLNDGKLTTQTLKRQRVIPIVSILVTLGAGYAAWCLLQTSSLTLDRDAGTFVIDRGRTFFVSSLVTGPINEIENATLETDTGADRFVIVLQDGQRFSLGGFTDQGKQSEAVAAVNHFLQKAAQ